MSSDMIKVPDLTSNCLQCKYFLMDVLDPRKSPEMWTQTKFLDTKEHSDTLQITNSEDLYTFNKQVTSFCGYRGDKCSRKLYIN